jgi:hypothetical protein
VRIRDAKANFKRFIEQRGLALSSMAAPDAVLSMVEFYRTVRCTDVAPERGDALLYQWGLYNWGKGEHFEFNLTRQLIRRGGAADSDIHQLSLTLFFTPSPEFADVGKSDRWCWSVADLAPFESFIRQGQTYLAVATAMPISSGLAYGTV